MDGYGSYATGLWLDEVWAFAWKKEKKKKNKEFFSFLRGHFTLLYTKEVTNSFCIVNWKLNMMPVSSLFDEYTRVCNFEKTRSQMNNFSSSIIDGQNTALSQSREKGFQWSLQLWGRGNTIWKWSSLLLLLFENSWECARICLPPPKKSKTNIDKCVKVRTLFGDLLVFFFWGSDWSDCSLKTLFARRVGENYVVFRKMRRISFIWENLNGFEGHENISLS